jgi:hypothetical protein
MHYQRDRTREYPQMNSSLQLDSLHVRNPHIRWWTL